MHVQLSRVLPAEAFLKEYMELVTKSKTTLGYIEDITHMALGLTTEAAECADIVKKNIFYKTNRGDAAEAIWKQKEHMAEELGDVLWYVAGMAQNYGLNLVDVMQNNITKLQTRYPEKFKSESERLKESVPEGLLFNRNLDNCHKQLAECSPPFTKPTYPEASK